MIKHFWLTVVPPFYICSLVTDEALLRILELPILVVLDEAYIEFSGMESRIKWVKKHENLIVLRTFSKVAGKYAYFLRMNFPPHSFYT